MTTTRSHAKSVAAQFPFRSGVAEVLTDYCRLVPMLRRGNAIPRRSGVADVPTDVAITTCAHNAETSATCYPTLDHDSMNPYRILADLVVVFHFAYASFVFIGLIAILLGGWRKWAWVRNFWFRLLHFLMIAVVVEESLFDVACPLTDWEIALREKAGGTVEQGTFIGRIVHHLLFFDIPHTAWMPIYCLFGLIVLTTLFLVPPKWPKWKQREK